MGDINYVQFSKNLFLIVMVLENVILMRNHKSYYACTYIEVFLFLPD